MHLLGSNCSNDYASVVPYGFFIYKMGNYFNYVCNLSYSAGSKDLRKSVLISIFPH